MISAVESSPSPSSISKIATPKNLLSEVASGSVKVSQNVVTPFLFHRYPPPVYGAMIVIKHDLRASTTMAGRSARWLEMKTIPEHRTRCTKMTSQEALTRRALKRVGGNSSSKASRQTAQNRIRILALRTDTAA